MAVAQSVYRHRGPEWPARPGPLAYVLAARKRRLRRLCAQLPEAFEYMCRALRAGQPLSAAFHTVATRFDAPLAKEFSDCHEEQKLGVPHDDAPA